MQREQVTSSNLASVGYDVESSRLEIEFRHGGVYAYYSVPQSVHQALMRADSVGGYFSANIKGKYGDTKL